VIDDNRRWKIFEELCQMTNRIVYECGVLIIYGDTWFDRLGKVDASLLGKRVAKKLDPEEISFTVPFAGPYAEPSSTYEGAVTTHDEFVDGGAICLCKCASCNASRDQG
jgi:hypothetical protein